MADLPDYDDIRLQTGLNPCAVVLGGDHYNSLAIVRSLGRRKIPVISAATGAKPIAFYSRYAKRRLHYSDIIKNPKQARDILLEYCKKLNHEGEFPVLFPTGDRQVEFLSQFRDDFQDYARIHLPSTNKLRAIMDKAEQYALAEKLGIPYPKSWTNEQISELREELKSNNLQFPIIFKSRTVLPNESLSRSHKRILIHDLKHFDMVIREASDLDLSYVIQVFIPGGDDQLYTAGLIRTSNEKITGVFTGRKLRQMPPKFGICRIGESCQPDNIIKSSEKLLKAFGFFGIAQVEFKYDPRDKHYKLMEINPRSWSWIALPVKMGVDLPYLYFLDALGIEIDVRVIQDKENGLWVSFWDDLINSIRHRDAVPWKELFRPYQSITDAYFTLDDPIPGIRNSGPQVIELIKTLVKAMIGRK